MVRLPVRLPGLKPVTILTGMYAAVWMALEGDLRRILLLAGLVTIVATGRLFQRFWGGQQLPVRLWLLSGIGLGTLAGFAMGPLTLIFMAVKTGLHGHGPEFSPTQIAWVVGQMPAWLLAGLILGLAAALLYLGFRGTTVSDGA